MARNLTDPFDGFLLGKRYLIMDRDAKFSSAFRQILRSEDIETVRLPPRSPNLSPHIERFMKSIKEECLLNMIFFGETALRRAVDRPQLVNRSPAHQRRPSVPLRVDRPSLIIEDGSGVRRRNGEAEGWTLPCTLRFNPNPSAVHLDNPLHQGQATPEPSTIVSTYSNSLKILL